MDDADRHEDPGSGPAGREPPSLRPPRSGEGMASVIEHLREHLRQRRPDLDGGGAEPDDALAPRD